MEEIEKNTSAKKEGNGGADRVKKKDRTKTKANKGLKQIKPRIKTCWRVKKKEYITPTNIKSKGDLSPCKNIIEIKPLYPIKEEVKSIIGTVIIWETDE